MTVKTWCCNTCGKGYIGEDKPTHCPFCGAPAKYIVKAEDYKEPTNVIVGDKSKKNVMSAIKLEVSNASFYYCAAKMAKDVELKKRFETLGMVESEHALLLSRLIDAKAPEIDTDAKICKADDAALVKESHDRESSAIENYKRFFQEAAPNELRVKQVFIAIVEVENTHLELADGKK